MHPLGGHARSVARKIRWGAPLCVALSVLLGTLSLTLVVAAEEEEQPSTSGGWTTDSALILLGVLAVLAITMVIAMKISAPTADHDPDDDLLAGGDAHEQSDGHGPRPDEDEAADKTADEH